MARMKFICDSGHYIECGACAAACKNEHKAPWGVNHCRVVTINDGMIDTGKSISAACMHCPDMPCMAVYLVDCFYHTGDGVVLHGKDTCIGCDYCSYTRPSGVPQFPGQSTFGVRGKMDRCTFYVDDPEKNGSEKEFEKYDRNHLVKGKLPLCMEMYSTKALLGGDGDMISGILCNRVMKRGKGVGLFGWDTAYGGAQDKSGQAAPATPTASAKPAPVSGA